VHAYEGVGQPLTTACGLALLKYVGIGGGDDAVAVWLCDGRMREVTEHATRVTCVLCNRVMVARARLARL